MNDSQEKLSPRLIRHAVLWLLLVGIVAVAHVLVFNHTPGLRFSEDALRNVGSVFAPLVLVALLVERAVEVIITPVRAKHSEELDIQKKSAQDRVVNFGEPTSIVEDLDARIIQARDRTRNHAFAIAVFLGLIASLSGLRGLEGLLRPGQEIPRLFQVFDVLLTGLVIGGGADGLHKIVQMFTDYAEKISRDAKKQT